jgi:hypothetical protein
MSHDNRGAPGDRDVPYVPLRTPNLAWPYPFTEREYVRLMLLRGRVRDAAESGGRYADDQVPLSLQWRQTLVDAVGDVG